MQVWIDHPVVPSELLLVWQAPDAEKDRLRWAVGILKTGSPATFRYFSEEELPSYNIGRSRAQLNAAGFSGYPAFRYDPGKQFDVDVLKTFMRRIPPASRNDFGRYQEYFSIRPQTGMPDMLLLALTEARLPGDGFSLVDPLNPTSTSGEAVVEIAGYRYEAGGSDLLPGDVLVLKPDPTNRHDCDAVAIFRGDIRVGFVNRLQALTVCRWLETHEMRCEVLRKNGRADAPRAYAKISFALKGSEMAA